MIRLVQVEIVATANLCREKCPWWDKGFGGRPVCSLFEQILQRKGKDCVRAERCKQQELPERILVTRAKSSKDNGIWVRPSK